jgi:hypothetical protein
MNETVKQILDHSLTGVILGFALGVLTVKLKTLGEVKQLKRGLF